MMWFIRLDAYLFRDTKTEEKRKRERRRTTEEKRIKYRMLQRMFLLDYDRAYAVMSYHTTPQMN